jgi:hypothetical protein
MTSRRILPALVMASFVLVPNAVSLEPAHAGEITMRYASPTGTDLAECTIGDPCSITRAINQASSGSHVFIEPGTYGSPQPLKHELYNPDPLTVQASDPANPPRIVSHSDEAAILLYGSTVSHLVLISSASTTGLFLEGGSGDHIAVFASKGGYGACSIYNARLTDSLCAETHRGDPAIGMSEGGSGTDASILRGVTAIASGKHGIGLNSAESGLTTSISVTNSIIRGDQTDIRLFASGGSMAGTFRHTAFRPHATDVTGGATIKANKSNVARAPKFVDPNGGNFQEKRSSPTVNAGAKDPAGDTDLAGNPRTLGSAPDIGAFELAPAPAIHKLKVVNVHGKTAKLTALVSSEGLRTHARIVAT